MKWNYKMTEEMMNIINALYEEVGMDCDACCERCPYASMCNRDNGGDLFYQCSVWEDAMGADL